MPEYMMADQAYDVRGFGDFDLMDPGDYGDDQGLNDEPAFSEGETVEITGGAYEAVAYEYEPDQVEYPLDEVPDGTYEVVSWDWDGGTVYNLRFNGVVDGHDYVRVWSVQEEDLRPAS